MAKSCLSCVHLKPLRFGDGVSLFCTRLPPRVDVARGENGAITLTGWYPPEPTAACGEHKRAWWRRPLKRPVAVAQ